MDLGPLLREQLDYIVTHVSLPPKLPQHSDRSPLNEYSLCSVTYHCAVAYKELLPQGRLARWEQIVRLLENVMKLHASDNLSPDEIQHFMAGLMTGGTQTATSSCAVTFFSHLL